jgi:1-acyl-sn-glycerol-3-phosphate acyltransferase
MNKLMRFFYEWFVTLCGAVFFIFSGLFLSLIGLCLKPFLNRAQAQRYGRYGMHYASKFLFAGLDISGLVQTDFTELDRMRHEQGVIITPNHPCIMDALFISSRLPNVVCVMKASILSNPIFFGCASLGGFISSDSPIRFVEQCQEALAEGAQLLLFPEGTRTVNGKLNPFKGGFSLIARKTGAPVQAVFIEANTNFLGKNWPLWKKPEFPLIYRATLAERFIVESSQDHRSFTKKLEKYFKNHLGARI